jgi:hypothetical protein
MEPMAKKKVTKKVTKRLKAPTRTASIKPLFGQLGGASKLSGAGS